MLRERRLPQKNLGKLLAMTDWEKVAQGKCKEESKMA
jgi:hypothetical protein